VNTGDENPLVIVSVCPQLLDAVKCPRAVTLVNLNLSFQNKDICNYLKKNPVLHIFISHPTVKVSPLICKVTAAKKVTN
jgi:hypothetical protein